jgi:hypothetical protein
MAQLQFSFDTGNVPLSRIVDAFASAYGYDDNKLANETKADFARRMVRRYIVEIVKAQEQAAARIAAEGQVTDINLS